MKKLFLALLLAVSVTPIASISADTTSREITPGEQGGNGNGSGDSGNIGGGETTPPTNPNPDQGQGGETTPPTNPNPDQGGSEQKPPVKPEQPKPDVVQVQYAITMPIEKNRVVTVSQVNTLNIATDVYGAKGEKITWINDVEQTPHDPAEIAVSKIDTTLLLKPQTITFTVGGQAPEAISENASLVVVPDTYTVSGDYGAALSVDPALTVTQAEAKALTATTLATKLNATGIKADATTFEVKPVDDAQGNLQKVLSGTPGTWAVKFSGQNPSAAPGARANAEFVATAQITVLDNQEAVLPEANTEGALRPDQVLTQTGNVDATPVTAVGAANTTLVPTGASNNVIALLTTVLVAASLILVVKRTRK